MVVRFTVLFVTTLIINLFCGECSSAEQTSDKLHKFISRSLEELNSASFKIPQFKSATVDAIENRGKIDGVNLYLCWLKSNQGRVGYISLIGGEGSYQIVSISATTTDPGYFLKHLQVRELKKQPLRLSRTAQVSFITDVPLVAATRTRLGGEPVELSEVACCLSSVFQYLQYEKGMLLFGHPGYRGSSEYFRPYRQDLVDKKKLKEIQEKTVARKKETNWRPFLEEFREALAREKISPGKTPEERVAYMVNSRRVGVPILRRRLLNPISPMERFNLILSERGITVTPIDTSRGMRDAILIQEDYLKPDTAKLEQGIDMFFKTRGIAAELSFSPFKKLRPAQIPAILVGPGESAGVLLGYIDIDGESFAFIFFPKTGKPIIMSLADKTRAIRKEHGIPEPNEVEVQKGIEKRRKSYARLRALRKERGIPNPPDEVPPEEALARRKAMNEKMIVVEDRIGELPGSLEYGVHLVRCSGLASWQGLYIGKIVAGENWGVLPWKSENSMTK